MIRMPNYISLTRIITCFHHVCALSGQFLLDIVSGRPALKPKLPGIHLS